MQSIRVTHLDAMSAVRAVNSTLSRIDTRLVDHGDRVAYIACRLCRAGKLDLDLKKLFVLCVFHDIGAYKTEEIDRMVEFETHDVWNHSIYGYLFMKYLSPVGGGARALLFHHTPWHELSAMADTENDETIRYAAMINLADRIDIASLFGEDSDAFRSLWNNRDNNFCPEYVELFHRIYNGGELFRELSEGVLRANLELCKSFAPSAEEAVEYLKMIVFSIDFRSDQTVTHTVNTIALALNIARHFGVPDEELDKIYLGALLHDVGKITIPESILECPGRLTDEQMKIMRTHVEETDKLIRGIVSDEICDIAVRHHEKLDGSGYPKGLCAKELSFDERTVAVADIVSALTGRRSYKEPFPKEKTIEIIMELAGAKLDGEICSYVCENYDTIVAETDASRENVIEKYQRITDEYELIQCAAQNGMISSYSFGSD